MSIDSTVNLSASQSADTYHVLSRGGRAKLDRKVVQVSGMRGATGRGVQFTISNIGTGYLRLGTDAFSFSGTDGSQFAVVSGSLPRNIPPGKRATFTVALKANSSASVTRVLTSTLSIKQQGSTTPIAALSVRGVATTGVGGDKEPSLARLLELFQLDVNVGDTTPNTTFLDLDGSPTDQITAPRFYKAANAPVTVQTLAQFVNGTSTVAGRFGTYDPGSPDTRKTLFSLAGIDAQTVNPTPNGSSSFDPGTRQFSVWAEAPTFVDDGQSRIIYGEDALNTFEPNIAKRNKVRVYPLKENGEAVKNAYVVAFEEYTHENDQNDYVFIIRNVTASKSQPELGLITLNGQPDSDRLAFNRIETPDTTTPNLTADVESVRIVNTGNKDLTISSVTLDALSTDFQILNAPSSPLTIRRGGGSFDLNVKFVANGGDTRRGTIVLHTNDRDEPTRSIALTGFWQSDSEMNSGGISQEPTLPELFNVLGFRTSALNAGQVMDQNGATATVGDEVLADAWAAADPTKPVFVQELSDFHTQGNIDQIAWYPEGHPYYGASDPRNPGPATNGPRNVIYENDPAYGQSLLPKPNASSDSFAHGSFKPGTTPFGLRVSGEFSDDELNNQVPGDLGGHHFRFFPARDSDNNFIADTWLVAMDFASINFDYNDHLMLVRNMKPADRPASVFGLSVNVTEKGNVFDWADVPGAAGYSVLRADKSGGPYIRISDDVLTTSAFTDRRAPAGRTRYYRVVALNADGDAGMPENMGVTRPVKA